MLYMRIHCGACGGTWEVYRRGRDTSGARTCPHCDYTIDQDTWKKVVLPAFQTVENVNLTLAQDHIEKHSAEFEVDFIADGRFQNADKAEAMNEIRSRLDAMQERLDILATNDIERAFHALLNKS